MPEFNGIDVSEWQGDIDWKAVKASGVDFAILRAGYGKYISQKDKKFEQNYANAKAAGIKVGAYWYSYAVNAQDAAKEADVFKEVLKGKQFEYPVFLDIEDPKQTSKAICSAVIPTFLERLKNGGYYVGLYTFRNFLKAYVEDKFVKQYDFWLAHVTKKTDYSGHKIWQYTFTATCPGIKGTIDKDISYVDYPSIIKAAGKNGFTAPATTKPAETTKPVTENTKPSTPTTSTPTTQKPTTTTTKPAETTKPATTTLTTGAVLNLKDTRLYGSSTASNPAAKKTGTFYVYNNEVVNGRIRITNSASNVGRTPSGTYVTGWVNVSDLGSGVTPTQQTTKPADKPATSTQITAGKKITLTNAPLYASATATVKAANKTGTFYIYSAEITNNRIRITNDPSRVNKLPVGVNVTGWINVSDIK